MHCEIVIAGFGGQGVLFAGQLLAYAAMAEGKQVTWIPSYGPEMRGGTANCTVVVADEEIGSPLVRHPEAAVALNLPSLDKYEPLVKSGGVLVADTKLAGRSPTRTDLRIAALPAVEIAERAGDRRMQNIVALGALLVLLPVLPLAAVETALREHVAARHQDMLEADIRALRMGADAMELVKF